MAAFSLWPEFAREVNRHFVIKEYGDLSFSSLVLNTDPFQVQNIFEETIIGNVTLASKCKCDDIIRNYMDVYKVLQLLLNERGDTGFISKFQFL